jgi:hypothetical protein
MTPDRQIEGLLHAWLGEGPTVSGDHVLDAVAGRIGGVRQRPAWRVPSGRNSTSARFRLAAIAAAALVVVAIVGLSIGGPHRGIGVLPVPPSASPLASPSQTPAWSIPTIAPRTPPPSLGPLAAGTHHTQGFAVPFSYEVPDGWTLESDGQTAFALSPTSPDHGGIELLFDAFAPLYDGCLRRIDWERPHGARDFIAGLRSRPGFSVTSTERTIGGLTAFDLRVTIGEAAQCGQPDEVAMGVPLYEIRWSDGIPFTLATGLGTRSLTVVDDGQGGTIVLDDRADADYAAEAGAIIDSFDFAP